MKLWLVDVEFLSLFPAKTGGVIGTPEIHLKQSKMKVYKSQLAMRSWGQAVFSTP